MALIREVMEQLDRGDALSINAVGNLCGWNIDTITAVIKEVEECQWEGNASYFRREDRRERAVGVLREALAATLNR